MKTTLPTLIESFFVERLAAEKQVSHHTTASYRDTFRLLFLFLQGRLHKPPSLLSLDDLTEGRIVEFLRDLERTRRCSARTRNQRLSAIRSFFRYLSYRLPERSGQIQKVLSIPNKRHDRALVDYLDAKEISALTEAPDRSTWTGRRDHLLLLVAVQTGVRLSELTALTWDSVTLGRGAHIRVLGKGRKQRSIPLSKETACALVSWRAEQNVSGSASIFPSCRGGAISSDAVQRLLSRHVLVARETCPAMSKKRISLHVLRHSAAMQLLQAGVGQSVIALWLGHESVDTTQIYLNADLKMKEKALKKVAPSGARYHRYRPGDRLLAFLESL